MMFFQSISLRSKAILMNLASIPRHHGVLVRIFPDGWGASLFNFPRQ
jgi:hypothetical protein